MPLLHTLGWIFLLLPIAIGLYAYIGYPTLLRLLPRYAFRQNPVDPSPMVSIVIPAYNEERQIRGAVEAAIAQRYPAERRQILVVSDASTDRTDEIVGEYAAQGVELLRIPERGGKTAVENASIPHLRGEIIVNTDSSVRLHPDVVPLLVAAMADPHVGVASTRDVSISRMDTTANAAEAGYVDYEMGIRALETATGGIVGASGSGYAIRRELHRIPVRQDLSRDFSAALTAEKHGLAAVSVDNALCYVPRTQSLRAEYRRKVRTIARGMDTLYFNRHLLDPMRHGAFAWKLLSHKLARWAVPVGGVIAAIGLLLLAPHHWWADVLLGLGAIAVIMTGIVAAADRPVARPLSMLAFAVAGNVAVVHALMRVLFGHEDHVWEPTRRSASN